jgi:hypothetical protein
VPAGLSPRQVANQLERCYRAEVDILRVLGGWTARVTENDERLAFAREVGFRAEHGEALRHRLHRLRTTDAMIGLPDEPWRSLIALVDTAPSTADLVVAVHRIIGVALIDAYEQLVADADPLADELTIRLVERNLLPDHRERAAWAEGFLRDGATDGGYADRVTHALAQAGGLVVRSAVVANDRTDDEASNGTGFWPLSRPSEDRIELGAEYRIAADGEPVSFCPPFEEFGPRDVEVLVIHHGLMPEIASLCIIGAVLHEVHDRPWAFYRDFAVQCADEVRHIGLLLRRLDELGAGPGTHAFPTWTFYDAVAYLPAAERTLVFNAIVEGNVVETLHDRAAALERAGNPEAAYVMDWISADESLHLHNGMAWLDASGPDIDALLDRGQALLGEVMRQKGTTEKVFDSASEALSAGDFYSPRKNPIAPIARRLGGFDDAQIERLIESAGGRTIRR